MDEKFAGSSFYKYIIFWLFENFGIKINMYTYFCLILIFYHVENSEFCLKQVRIGSEFKLLYFLYQSLISIYYKVLFTLDLK
jgi:hypothetical protein